MHAAIILTVAMVCALYVVTLSSTSHKARLLATSNSTRTTSLDVGSVRHPQPTSLSPPWSKFYAGSTALTEAAPSTAAPQEVNIQLMTKPYSLFPNPKNRFIKNTTRVCGPLAGNVPGTPSSWALTCNFIDADHPEWDPKAANVDALW